MIVLRSTQKT